jgi:hypothetical protein
VDRQSSLVEVVSGTLAAAQWADGGDAGGVFSVEEPAVVVVTQIIPQFLAA